MYIQLVADVSSSTLLVPLLAPCSQAIFSNKYSPPSTNRTPRRIYNRSIYHQAPTAPPTKFSPGIIFTTRCRSHCCGGTQLLSYSVPRRKFRYVLFSLWHFWGTDYWQFFGVFVRHWQLLERRADLWETREVFPDKPQLVIGAPSSNLADLTWRGGQTKIWANTKP